MGEGSQVMPLSPSVQDQLGAPPPLCLLSLLGSGPALHVLLLSKTFSRERTWHLSLYLRADCPHVS